MSFDLLPWFEVAPCSASARHSHVGVSWAPFPSSTWHRSTPDRPPPFFGHHCGIKTSVVAWAPPSPLLSSALLLCAQARCCFLIRAPMLSVLAVVHLSHPHHRKSPGGTTAHPSLVNHPPKPFSSLFGGHPNPLSPPWSIGHLSDHHRLSGSRRYRGIATALSRPCHSSSPCLTTASPPMRYCSVSPPRITGAWSGGHLMPHRMGRQWPPRHRAVAARGHRAGSRHATPPVAWAGWTLSPLGWASSVELWPE
jgi:hypothetical protein